MGIDTDRFVSKSIDEGLICSICAQVLEKPLMVDTCEHTYCEQCIKEWYGVDRTCPQCRIPITERQLLTISRYMRNRLNELQLICKFESIGCTFVSALENIESHEKECLCDEINTRVTREVITDSNESSYLTRIQRHRYRYEHEVVRSAIPEATVKNAIKLAKEALYLCGRVNFGQIAAYIKTNLEPEDSKYWHCVAGNDYDCLLTCHSYITLKIDGIYIIAFKTK